MPVTRRSFVGLAAATAVLPSVTAPAVAEAYPSRPITVIVPYGAGGPTDTIARIVTGRMRQSLGQPVIIENVPGASASLGVGRAARANPDGYTLCFGTWASHVLNGAIYSLSYDLQSSFSPIAQIASDPPLIISRKDIPAGNLTEFIAWLKANPDKATEGTGGVGSVSHVAGVFFQKQTGTKFQFIPYSAGVGVAMQDVIAGHIDLMFSVAASAIPLIRAGEIKGYAVTSKSRLAVAPEVPTVDEAGLPGFYMSNWHGIWAPQGTPADVIKVLNAAVVDALKDPDVKKGLFNLGQEIAPLDRQSPEGLASLQRSEIEKWWPILKDAGIKLD